MTNRRLLLAERPTGLICNRRGCSSVACRGWCQPRASGGRRSEVKEEGRAQPDPGDMSGVGHPAALARAAVERQSPQCAEG